LNNLGYFAIRYAVVSKTFYQIVFLSITDLTSLFDLCWKNEINKKFLAFKDVNDEFIQRFKNLQVLDRGSDFAITDIGLKSLKKLTILELGYNKTITDEGIKGLTNITALGLCENENISDDGIKVLTNMQHLILRVMKISLMKVSLDYQI
jgi:hypothetical protein